jgi:hypothetical protein
VQDGQRRQRPRVGRVWAEGSIAFADRMFDAECNPDGPDNNLAQLDGDDLRGSGHAVSLLPPMAGSLPACRRQGYQLGMVVGEDLWGLRHRSTNRASWEDFLRGDVRLRGLCLHVHF